MRRRWSVVDISYFAHVCSLWSQAAAERDEPEVGNISLSK
jgi:hypothetical protein